MINESFILSPLYAHSLSSDSYAAYTAGPPATVYRIMVCTCVTKKICYMFLCLLSLLVSCLQSGVQLVHCDSTSSYLFDAPSSHHLQRYRETSFFFPARLELHVISPRLAANRVPSLLYNLYINGNHNNSVIVAGRRCYCSISVIALYLLVSVRLSCYQLFTVYVTLM